MRDRPGRPDEPDDHNDQPREQPDETDQPRKWHEFALDDDFDEGTARAAEQKQIMRAEGLDEAILTETFGTDEELGIAEADDEPNDGEPGDEPEPSGWDEPAVSDNPDRPDLDELHLPDKRREHIANNHVSGVGKATKTEYPVDWDEDTIMNTVLDVARNPTEVPWQQDSGLWVVDSERDGMTVRTIIRPSDNAIMTGYPLPGGDGVVQNPRKGQA